MTVRIRRNLLDLPATDKTLDWYRKAIGVLVQRPDTDPSSWRYVGAVHGNFNLQKPATLNDFRDQCHFDHLECDGICPASDIWMRGILARG